MRATTAATTKAAPVCSRLTPGSTADATQTAAAPITQDTISRATPMRGVAGSQRTCSP